MFESKFCQLRIGFFLTRYKHKWKNHLLYITLWMTGQTLSPLLILILFHRKISKIRTTNKRQKLGENFILSYYTMTRWHWNQKLYPFTDNVTKGVLLIVARTSFLCTPFVNHVTDSRICGLDLPCVGLRSGRETGLQYGRVIK